MDDDDDRDAAFRAIGRFAYEFSRMIWHMRFELPRMTMAPTGTTVSGAAWSAFLLHTGDMGAEQLVNTYFAVAQAVGDYDEQEGKMAAAIRNRLLPMIQLRNDFFHGEWRIGWVKATPTVIGYDPGEASGVTPSPPSLSRTKASRSGTQKMTTTEYTVGELSAIIDDFVAHRSVAIEWGWLVAGDCLINPEVWPKLPHGSEHWLPTARPRDVYTMQDGNVVRAGPLAARVDQIHTT